MVSEILFVDREGLRFMKFNATQVLQPNAKDDKYLKTRVRFRR